MKVEEIGTIKLDAVRVQVTKETEALAREAAQKLRYDKLATHITRSEPLADTLKALEIEPLNPVNVAKYKKSRERSGMWDGHVLALWLIPVVLGVGVSASVLSHLAHVAPNSSREELACGIAAPVAWALTMTCMVVCLVSAFVKERRGSRTVWRWREMHLANYAGTVPVHVLRKALAIQKLQPSCLFTVEQLEVVHEEVVPDPDPFLVAILGNERYYIEVWEEREYEQKM